MADKYLIDGVSREVLWTGWDETSAPGESDPLRIGVRRTEGDVVWLRIGARRERAVVVPAEGGTWVWHAGRARFVESEQAERRRLGKRTGLPGAVTPPMPATVVRILVEKDQSVDQGQGLVVVSAMKMETTLCSPHAGVVAAINTEVGASVKPGQILVDVTKTDEPPSDPA